jgi:predicted dehydrogenase
MARTFRIGVLGLTHDHVWGNLRDLRETGSGELVAAADRNLPLLEKVRHEHGCTTYPDYEALLSREHLDAVYVFSDNASAVELTERAAAKGLHVLVEKPMAADLAGADLMLAAARRAGVRLMINWPFAWWPQMQQALRMALAGDIGTLWQVRYRASHNGPRQLGCSEYFCDWLYDPQRNGAGALMDYCCYGAALARCLLGMPSRVTGVAGRLCKEDISVEDNAVLLLSYARALAVSEASWSQVGDLGSYVTWIYGSAGTLLVQPKKVGRLSLATADCPEGRDVEVPQPAPELRSASANFLHGIETGQPFFCLTQDRVGRDVQEILEAGLTAAAMGKEMSLPLRRTGPRRA